LTSKLSRRKFLKTSGYASAYALLARYPQLQALASGAAEADILVIGAGAAGLAAARVLQGEGYRVIILEARDRVGGRVWTDRSLGMPLDLGASWIHGVEGNPLTELVEQFDIETAGTDYENVLLYDSDGRPLTSDEQEALAANFEAVMEEAEAIREDAEADASLQDALDTASAGMGFSEQEQRHLDYAVNAEIEHDYAADVSDLSLLYWDEGEAFEGEDVLFPGGYDQIIHALADGLDIRLEHIVTHVDYGDDGVKVATTQGDFQADRAIVTLPLGVLKHGAVEFTPSLPDWKQAAISRLAMGVYNKVYLRFPTVFWPEAPDFLNYIAENKGEWAVFLNILKHTGEPVLLGFNAGEFGRQIESLADEEIVRDAMRVLRVIFGQDAPDPEAWLITRWASDPFAGGSYSYLAVGASPDDYDALAEPVMDRLFFAGEATSRDYAATVHGALLSGEQTAEWVMEIG
jgi:monoamine oxidase